MKPTRILASATLLVSSIALITAAGISVGDEPGVVRMGDQSPSADFAALPTPEPGTSGVATLDGGPADSGMGMYPQPAPYAPYFERSYGATQQIPHSAYQPAQPFGPIMMFETNIGDGLGYEQSYQRLNARIPYHIIPNTNVLIGDISASVTNNGDPLGNAGLIYRNYDSARNRIFGVNGYFDYDQGYGNGDWYQAGAGFESLGKYLDFRLNGYFAVGNDSQLLSSSTSSNLALLGNGAFKVRTDNYENAYSGLQAETGGPLPVLGDYGINMYAGAYFLHNDNGKDATGFQARWEAMITESLRVNTYLTTDRTFGMNSWVSLQYDLPNYKNRRVLRRSSVRDRLQDPVVRDNRIHVHRDTQFVYNPVINTATGVGYKLLYVDPNRTTAGAGTFENPYGTLASAAIANNSTFDIIRVVPRADDSTTNLTVNGGMSLFDDQTLLSSLKPLTLAADCIIPADIGLTTTLGPLISNPTMVAGGSVVRIGNNNSIIGMRIDAANAAGTVFGNGVVNPLPITDANLTCNIFTNYTNGALLQDVSGRIIVDQNEFNGLAGVSLDGLDLTVAGGSSVDLLVRNNIASNNSGTGLSIVANPGSTIHADDPNGFGGVATGIVNNTTNFNGTGIVTEARAGSTINAVVEGNVSTNNTNDGFVARADGGTYNLSSLATNTFSNNLGNGGFIHFQNGGVFNAVSEDLNGNGTLDAGEDLNGNGRFDRGIVSNTMNQNSIAGLCIFGEDASTGTFDIGGPTTSLGNTFLGNTYAGIATDLRDTSTAQIDALFNTISGGNSGGPAGLTIVLDFIDPGQAGFVDFAGEALDPFDVTNFGFAPSQYDVVTNSVLDTVRNYFRTIPTVTQDARSSIPDGMELDIDFVIGDNGVAPSNGATEYYVMNIGDAAAGSTAAGGLAILGAVRNATGTGPNFITLGDDGGTVYANTLTTFGPLTPANAYDIRAESLSDAPAYAASALTSGNLTFTRRALGLVTSHEIGHNLSLEHVDDTGAITPTGANPIMGTPAAPFLLPIQTLIEPAEFAFSATHLSEGPGDTTRQQFDIQQLVGAVGVRAAASGDPTAHGIIVNATDNAQLLPSTFNNNRITGVSQDGIAIVMNDNAVAQGVTIQSNTITNGGGNGVRLEANGPGAVIHATSTIGGTGVNVYSGTSYNQGNTISGNGGDGFRALAANGGMIDGNLLNNSITNNSGNGASFLIDNGGFIDFGTLPNRRIAGNTITGNGGAGLLFNQLVAANNEAQLDATVIGNTISNNTGGGIVANMLGPNNTPPLPPAIVNNNRLNLKIGGTAASSANTINGNSDVGIGVNVAGNSKAVVDILNTTVTGTLDGPDPLRNGDGLALTRADSSLLLATVTNSSFTGNAGDGMDVNAQGNDRFDPNQPMSGTANMVTVLNSIFNNNTGNGAQYRLQGDATLIGDMTGSTFNNNGQNGTLVQASQNSSFGDPTDGLPPGRRSIFDGNTFNNNGVDGVQLVATDDSRVLVEITSNRIAAGSSAHAAANTNGDTSISRNGRDGVRITTPGGRSDILITSGTGQTTIDGNGTAAGGNGIRWDSSGDSQASVRVTNTTITNSIAGLTEDTATNGNGVLDPGEDLNGNGTLDPGEDTNANADVDVVDGDGIQANFTGNTDATLIVGGVGEGNMIQSNADDGIAITATGRTENRTTWSITPPAAVTPTDLTPISDIGPVQRPTPIISIVGNTIGGQNNGIAAGNRGDGISINTLGGTDIGTLPANVDSTISIPPSFADFFVSDNFGAIETGAIPQITISDNLISQNTRRGANVLLTGAGGTRNREFGQNEFDPIRITFTDNTIVSNGEEGIYYRADSDMTQNRFVYLPNFPIVGPPANDNLNFSPFRPEFFALNAGSINGNTSYMPRYLNLRTVQNSYLTVTGNTIKTNGTGGVSGEGLFIKVGTGSYVAADVQDNVFGGNLEEDFRTASFVSSTQTFNSVDRSGDGTFDFVYLDDTAQLDLRFQTNQGNQIDTSSRGDNEVAADAIGATYTNNDPLKFNNNIGGRRTDLFQVDNGPFLNDPNNSFVNFGLTQNIQNAFTAGGYNIRAAADPLFPNIGFPPFLP